MKTYAHSIIRHMQKGLLITVAALMSHQVHGQGTVIFSNGRNSPVGTPCSPNGFTPAPAGTTISVALYFAPPDPANPNVQPTAAVFPQVGTSAFLVSPGIYDAGIRTAPVTPPGGFGWFQVKAWESAYGSTYEQVAG